MNSGLILRRLGITSLAIIFFVGLLTGTVHAKKNEKQEAPKIDPSKIVWPPPPLQPRIKWMAQYHGQSDFAAENKKKSGWLEKAAGISSQAATSDMLKPFGVAVDSKGLIYVTDQALNALVLFDTEKKKVIIKGTNAGVDLMLPTGIAIDDKDRIFVTEAFAHQIVCLSPTFEVVQRFGEKDVKRAAGVAVDNALRRIYVVDSVGRRLAIFDLDTFKFIRYMAEAEKVADKAIDAPGKLIGPTTIAVDGEGLIYIVDSLLNRVEVFDAEGTYIRGIGAAGLGAGGFQRAKGVAVDTDGHIYVSDTTSGNVQMFDSTGQALMPIGGAGFSPGRFANPAGITVDRFNRLIVVEQMTPRIQLFRYVTDDEVGAASAKTTTADGK